MEHPLKPPQDPRLINSATVNNPNYKLWLMSAVIIVALLLVLLVLPKMVADPATKAKKAAVEVEQQAVEEAPLEPVAINSDEVNNREDAQLALQSFLRLQSQPELINADVWAHKTWTTAVALADAGDQAFGAEKYSIAVSKYQVATKQLQSIVDNRDQSLLQYLISGWRFLTDNALEDARHAFDRVLLMQADHQQAQLGLKQTAARRQVLELMQTGQQAEITDALQLAADAYAAALQLDMHYLPADEGLKRVSLELKKRAFRDAMGLALYSLDQGRFIAADKALQQAAVIYPDDIALKAARQRLLTDRRQASLHSLRRQAEQLVVTEDWTAAAKKYRQALAIDQKAAFADNGLAKAEKKIKLHQQLDHYLADPTRLYSKEPLKNASGLLEANRDALPTEAKLVAKLFQLEQVVTLAITPVVLLITSDSLTEISIYKVGQLGAFAEKQLSLMPGKYTILGTRKGYRDVLKVMDLKPARTGQTISLQTGEKF